MHGRLRRIRAAYLSLECLSVFSFTLSPHQRNHIIRRSRENILYREFDQFRLIHPSRLMIYILDYLYSGLQFTERDRRKVSSVFGLFKRFERPLIELNGKFSTIFYHWLCKEWFVMFFFFLFKREEKRKMHTFCTCAARILISRGR